MTLFYETLTYFITVYNELEECAVISEEIWLKNERERVSRIDPEAAFAAIDTAV